MKKTLGALMAATAMSIAAPALAADIIVVAHGQANDPFWSVVKNGVETAAKHSGATVEYRSPETFDMVAMSQLIDAAVNQQPDGLVVSIPDADALGPSIQRAVEAGIPVISINSGSDVSKSLGALLHIGQDEEATPAAAAGEKLKPDGRQEGHLRQPGGGQRLAGSALRRFHRRFRRQCDGAADLRTTRPRCSSKVKRRAGSRSGQSIR
ncbi:MAG: substrate-binding domain-containing protein [Gemmobacter sp.]|nr:substrate-binding domain-containing protein [Gemmobacter sp.]